MVIPPSSIRPGLHDHRSSRDVDPLWIRLRSLSMRAIDEHLSRHLVRPLTRGRASRSWFASACVIQRARPREGLAGPRWETCACRYKYR
ncbi:Hypothetical protein A7982_02301 [Minicystis rosea]|nr:Hypothetical protein A7982_02301 [Minicystis rosea]